MEVEGLRVGQEEEVLWVRQEEEVLWVRQEEVMHPFGRGWGMGQEVLDPFGGRGMVLQVEEEVWLGHTPRTQEGLRRRRVLRGVHPKEMINGCKGVFLVHYFLKCH